MKRLALALSLIGSPAFAAADLVPTQANESSSSSFDRQYATAIGNDTAEALSTASVIVATAHAARVGDILRFTTVGANYLVESHVASTTANTITLTKAIPAAPGLGDGFTILRLLSPSVETNGAVDINGSFTVSPAAHAFVTSVRNDYTSVPVGTGAWVQLIASTSGAITNFNVFDSCGQTLELGTGAAAAETRVLIIPPGGLTTVQNLNIPASTRISARAISGNCTTGELDMSFYN